MPFKKSRMAQLIVLLALTILSIVNSQETTTGTSISTTPSGPFKCLACGSTNGDTPDCVDHPEKLGLENKVVCGEGMDHCFARRTEFHKKGSSHVDRVDFNRGCCKVEEGSEVCPTDPRRQYGETFVHTYCICNNSSLCNTDTCIDDQPIPTGVPTHPPTTTSTNSAGQLTFLPFSLLTITSMALHIMY